MLYLELALKRMGAETGRQNAAAQAVLGTPRVLACKTAPTRAALDDSLLLGPI